jgi:hypothetical protein
MRRAAGSANRKDTPMGMEFERQAAGGRARSDRGLGWRVLVRRVLGRRVLGHFGAGAVTLAVATLGLVVVTTGDAEAGCVRRIVNRSPYFAVASRNGGPGVEIPPHGSRSIRLLAPGRLDIAAYCAGRTRNGRRVPVGAPVAQNGFTFMAVIDRCYYDAGGRTFVQGGTEPFVLNNPRDGDLIVGPFGPACPRG